MEHTADIRAEVWGNGFLLLLRHSVWMLLEAMGGDVLAAGDEVVQVDIQASNQEELLVSLLNEFLFQFATKKFIAFDFRPYELGPGSLKGTLLGRRVYPDEEKLLTELKSVTYHGLEIVRSGRKLKARIVIDV